MRKTIQIDNKEYILDVDKAKKLGVLEESIAVGNVYIHPTGNTNPFLLVKVIYDPQNDYCYQLLGVGCGVNSGPFFDALHSLLEIELYLKTKGMVFHKNVNYDISELVDNIRSLDF
jgi:hypothetical protein